MNNVVCERCYVVNGWIRSCNCKDGPLRTDEDNRFGITEPSTRDIHKNRVVVDPVDFGGFTEVDWQDALHPNEGGR